VDPEALLKRLGRHVDSYPFGKPEANAAAQARGGESKGMVERLDGVGGVDHLADFRRIGKKGGPLVPLPPSQPADRGGLGIPGAGKGVEMHLGLLGGGGLVDLLQVAGHLLAVLVGDKAQRLANQMDDTQLDASVPVRRLVGQLACFYFFNFPSFFENFFCDMPKNGDSGPENPYRA